MIEKNLNIETVDLDNLETVFMDSIKKDLSSVEEISLLEYSIKSFLYYGASAVAGRAIPHLTDGLKHGQRRALYTMKNDTGLSHTGAYKKSARVTGNIIGLYHPHGDSAAYDTLVNLVQPFKKNIPLADGQGGWGSIDGSNASAQRYTEIRMTPASSLMFNDIKMDTVDFIPNYDGTLMEPQLLPVPFPNILINGVPQGSIAVGMSSSILPHNGTEVMRAMVQMIENRKNGEETTAEELLTYIPAPDFPTGGYVYGTEGMIDIIKTGRGSVRLRAKHHIEELSRGRSCIVITEIPWGKNTTSLIQSVIDLVRNADKDDKLAFAITSINDSSDLKNGLRITIDVKAGYDPEIVWNYILKNTAFDTSHSYYSVVLDNVMSSNGTMSLSPSEYGLLEIFERYLDFRFDYFDRKHNFLIKKYGARLHILEGLLKAIDIIDELIVLIKSAENQDDAKLKIMDLDFSELQAEAIIAMRLGRLTKLPKEEFIQEKAELESLKDFSQRIIDDFNFKCDELINETLEVAKVINFDRRTEIKPELSGMDLEDIIPKEDCVIYVTNKGYVKRVSAKNINKQNRGTQGKKGIELTEGDFVEKIFHTNTHSIIMFVMNNGKIYGTKAYNVPDSNRGSFVDNIFETEANEKIVNVVEVEDFECCNIILVTEQGTVKSSELVNYKGCLRKPGVKGINLKDDDTVVSVKVVNTELDEEIVIATKDGKAIRFKVSEISVTGRTSAGVRGIKLKGKNKVIGSAILSKGTIVATITEGGMVKLSESSEFKIQKRGGIGVNCMNLTKKSGLLNSIISWESEEDCDLVTITVSGVMNRINTKEIRTTLRNTKGVKLVDLKDNDLIAAVLKVEKEEVEIESDEAEVVEE